MVEIRQPLVQSTDTSAATTSCLVSSLLEDGDRGRGLKCRRDKERGCWLKQVDEGLKERKRRTGFQAVRRNTCCSSAEEKEGVGGHCRGERKTGVVKPLSSLSACAWLLSP